ncbi:MAG: nuclear transport factor 2 family protein [Vicinamibacteria bacterium]
MKAVRTTAGAFGIAVLSAAMAAFHPCVAADAAVDPEVLVAREAAWRAYFGGDVELLGDLLPPEFIGIGWSDAPLGDRASALAGARAFHESGGRLVRLAFPETRAQRFGDVVVLYGRFDVVLESGGAERAFRGRLTEVFVKRDGKWAHPGWHLDLTAAQAPAGP